MNGKDEAVLPNIVTIDDITKTQMHKTQHISVSNTQTDIYNDLKAMEFDGAVTERQNCYHGQNEKYIVSQLVKSVKDSGKEIPQMDFPQIA